MGDGKYELKRALSREESRHSTRRKRTVSEGSRYERSSVISNKEEEVNGLKLQQTKLNNQSVTAQCRGNCVAPCAKYMINPMFNSWMV